MLWRQHAPDDLHAIEPLRVLDRSSPPQGGTVCVAQLWREEPAQHLHAWRGRERLVHTRCPHTIELHARYDPQVREARQLLPVPPHVCAYAAEVQRLDTLRDLRPDEAPDLLGEVADGERSEGRAAREDHADGLNGPAAQMRALQDVGWGTVFWAKPEVPYEGAAWWDSSIDVFAGESRRGEESKLERLDLAAVGEGDSVEEHGSHPRVHRLADAQYGHASLWVILRGLF